MPLSLSDCLSGRIVQQRSMAITAMQPEQSTNVVC